MSDRDLKNEMRCAIRFCHRLKKSAQETVDLLREAYKDDCLGDSTIFRWYNSFTEGRESAELIPPSGRPVTASTEVNTNTIAVLMQEDRHLTVAEIASIMNISVGTAHSILKDKLQLSRVCARLVPHMLTSEQMLNRINVCNEWKAMLKRDPTFLNRVITCDETWVHHHDPLTKQESSVWKHVDSPPPKKVRQTKSATKVMMLVFFDHEGVIYQHEVPHGVTVNADHYITALKTLKIHISRKRRHLVRKWILHHDNARPHTAARVLEFLTKSKITVMKHPPYSPDLAPCDFWMFPKLKEALRGQTFSSYQDIVTAVQGYFNTLDKNAFSTCFQKWILRWDRCIEARGRYFEKE